MPATFQWLAFFIELTPHPNPLPQGEGTDRVGLKV
ncbi:Uncharacterised protein [Serratia fonticola]|nr:Uncharacterised protein [Serratia fonticola]